MGKDDDCVVLLLDSALTSKSSRSKLWLELNGSIEAAFAKWQVGTGVIIRVVEVDNENTELRVQKQINVGRPGDRGERARYLALSPHLCFLKAITKMDISKVSIDLPLKRGSVIPIWHILGGAMPTQTSWEGERVCSCEGVQRVAEKYIKNMKTIMSTSASSDPGLGDFIARPAVMVHEEKPSSFVRPLVDQPTRYFLVNQLVPLDIQLCRQPPSKILVKISDFLNRPSANVATENAFLTLLQRLPCLEDRTSILDDLMTELESIPAHEAQELMFKLADLRGYYPMLSYRPELKNVHWVNPLETQAVLADRITCSTACAAALVIVRHTLGRDIELAVPYSLQFNPRNGRDPGIDYKGQMPVLVKPGLAGGGPRAHDLAICYSREGISNFLAQQEDLPGEIEGTEGAVAKLGPYRRGPPHARWWEVQELVEHQPSVCFKLFVLGDTCWVIPQGTIPNSHSPGLDALARLFETRQGKLATESVDFSPFSSMDIKACDHEFTGSWSEAIALEQVAEDLFSHSQVDDIRALLHVMRRTLKVEFFGVDLIKDATKGILHIVDVNNCPSYKGCRNHQEILMNYLS